MKSRSILGALAALVGLGGGLATSDRMLINEGAGWVRPRTPLTPAQARRRAASKRARSARRLQRRLERSRS